MKGSLITEGDSYLHVAIFNYYFESLSSFINSYEIGRPFYPESYPYLLGEPAAGIFPIWLLYKLIGFNQLWSYNLTIQLLLSLNAYFTYRIIRTIAPGIYPLLALTSGLIVSSNGFIAANLDSPNVICFFYGIAAILFYYKMIREKKAYYLLPFLCFILLQMIASMYNFMYVGFFIISITVVHLSSTFRFAQKNLLAVSASFIFLMLCLLFYLYILTGFTDKSAYHFWGANLEEIKAMSISWKDFVRPVKDGLYSDWFNIHSQYWATPLKALFLGFLVSFLGIIGLFKNIKRYPEFFIMVIISLILGAGSYAKLDDHIILLPLGWFFETFDLFGFFRFPFRFYLVVIFIFSILIPIYLNSKIKGPNFRNLIIILFIVLFLIENTPLKRQYFDSNAIFEEGDRLKKKYAHQELSNFLFLPTPEVDGSGGANFNRTEYIYMYYQTQIRKNILNGSDAFMPVTRIELSNVMNSQINTSDENVNSVRNLLKKNKIAQIVFYSAGWGFEEQFLSFETVKQAADQLEIPIEYK